jgi:hypothetical protein
MTSPLKFLPSSCSAGRPGRDRLELLQALIDGPGFDPVFRGDVISLPWGHPVYRWWCSVPECERPRSMHESYCHNHTDEWAGHIAEHGQEATRATFLAAAVPLAASEGFEPKPCLICPERPSHRKVVQLCVRHFQRWHGRRYREGGSTDWSTWLGEQEGFAGYGTCRAGVCTRLAATPVGLCDHHGHRYHQAGRPGGVALPHLWIRRYELHGREVPLLVEDAALFRTWCATEPPAYHFSQLNLVGLRPLAKAELKWGLEAHTRDGNHTKWFVTGIRLLTNACRQAGVESLSDFDLDTCSPTARGIVGEILTGLRPVYYTKADSRREGFIETDHFGRRFPESASYFDLTGVPQRWLRELLWDHLADLLQSADGPRSRGPLDALRRACSELGAFLEVDAPEAGARPELLGPDHVKRFEADQRYRAANAVP